MSGTVQELILDGATSGDFTLSYGSEKLETRLAHNATNTQVNNLIDSLLEANGVGDTLTATVTSGSAPYKWKVTFSGITSNVRPLDIVDSALRKTATTPSNYVVTNNTTPGSATVNEQWAVYNSANGGGFNIKPNNDNNLKTIQLPFDATPHDVELALEQQVGDVEVSGHGTQASPWIITFKETNVLTALTSSDNLLVATPASVPANSLPGLADGLPAGIDKIIGAKTRTFIYDSSILNIEYEGSGGSDRIVASLNALPDEPQIISGFNNSDTLIGADGRDILNGGEGADTLYGNAGQDNLNGDSRDDKIFGGNGTDTLLGGSGDDILYGGDGSDKIKGEAGEDILIGGLGALDTLVTIHSISKALLPVPSP